MKFAKRYYKFQIQLDNMFCKNILIKYIYWALLPFFNGSKCIPVNKIDGDIDTRISFFQSKLTEYSNNST